MNIFLWVLQILTALLYASSGVMKLFMFDKISQGVPSFGAMPRSLWSAFGGVEIFCALGLVIPGLFHGHTAMVMTAATILALESLVFIWVHIRYKETTTVIMSAVLGLIMAFIAYGRCCLKPLTWL